MIGREQRVERQQHDAGTHTAPERDWKVHGVVEQHGEPLFRAQPEIAQRRRKPAAARLQLAVSERTIRIDEGDFFAEAARHRGIDEIRDGVIGLAL